MNGDLTQNSNMNLSTPAGSNMATANNSVLASQIKETFENGKLYYDRADFTLAITKLTKAADYFYENRSFEEYLRCQNLLLRCFAEKQMYEAIHSTKEKLQDLVLREGFELNSKTYYTLALCASYKNQYDTAYEYLQKSLSIALATDNKIDLCYAISGIAIIYRRQGRFEEALKEYYNLQVFFQVIDLPEVKISTMIQNAAILIDLKKYDQAIDILWLTYEQVRNSKNSFTYLLLLYEMGRAYLRMGDKELARVYLNLAAHTCDPENSINLFKGIQELLSELGTDLKSSNYDLIFDLENHVIVEKKIGKVDFKNQFILLDLMKLFVQNQGQVFSKEYLVEHVWKQNYDPAVHDNKIYVTIKRLRRMIEPDYEKPKYIFRAKNGYYMNKTAKVLLDDKVEGARI